MARAVQVCSAVTMAAEVYTVSETWLRDLGFDILTVLVFRVERRWDFFCQPLSVTVGASESVQCLYKPAVQHLNDRWQCKGTVHHAIAVIVAADMHCQTAISQGAKSTAHQSFRFARLFLIASHSLEYGDCTSG